MNELSIEVRIRDIKKLNEVADKCFSIVKAHPYISKINIRVDEPNVPCKFRWKWHYRQRRKQHYLPRKNGK